MDDEDALTSMRNAVLDTIGDNVISLATPPTGEVAPPPPEDSWTPADLGSGQSAPALTNDIDRAGAQVAQDMADQGRNPLDFTDPDPSAAIGLP